MSCKRSSWRTLHVESQPTQLVEGQIVYVWRNNHLFLLLFLKIIAPIPKIEAAVPSTVLADMFGKATSDVFKRLDLGADGWMHFTNAAKEIFGALASTAPVLAPCLDLLGVGFGFINKELNSVSPLKSWQRLTKQLTKLWKILIADLK